MHIDNIKIKHFTFSFSSMTTHCEVQIYDNNEINALKCFEEIKENTKKLEKKYNFFSNSYLTKHINQRKRNKIKIDDETFNILAEVKRISLLTNNLFDITVGTIKHCYNKDSINQMKECLLDLKDKKGENTWYLNDKNLHFKYKETKLDLGGVIKEYSVDEAGKIVRKYNITSALINFGGDILTIGKKPDKSDYKIAIKNPLKKDENLLFIDISDQALTTSAHYERATKIENKDFSHIINTNNLNNDIISSTIIANSVLEAGIFSTSFMINPGCKLYDNLKILLIDKKLNLHQNLQ